MGTRADIGLKKRLRGSEFLTPVGAPWKHSAPMEGEEAVGGAGARVGGGVGLLGDGPFLAYGRFSRDFTSASGTSASIAVSSSLVASGIA